MKYVETGSLETKKKYSASLEGPVNIIAINESKFNYIYCLKLHFDKKLAEI